MGVESLTLQPEPSHNRLEISILGERHEVSLVRQDLTRLKTAS